MYTHSQYPDCSMYNSSLFNDLRQYYFSTTYNGSITYEANGDTYDVNLKIGRLDDIIAGAYRELLPGLDLLKCHLLGGGGITKNGA